MISIVKGGEKENRHAREENLGPGYKSSSINIIGRVIKNPGREAEEHCEVTEREKGIKQALLVHRGSKQHEMKRDFNAKSSSNSSALIL